ncbi:MAG: NADH-quinone oxidoreductase subunit C [Deltaproteobacteria bacterium]|nr:NADH-quinone oxidoreductase subunit C [Deltaproteobacteria bacterium]
MKTANGEALTFNDLPVMNYEDFRGSVISEIQAGARLSALPVFRMDDGKLRMTAVISKPASGEILLGSCNIPEPWRSLTPDCPSAHWFEREIAEIWKVSPEGHPWLKPIRFQPPHDIKSDKYPVKNGTVRFFSIGGEESHEVAVGPVHAGIIEPGHFRFICHGETVYHLEISLGYQHRGVERAMIGGPGPRSTHYMETLAGDTTIGHATAYCMALEAMSGVTAPPRAQAIRAIAAELERLANHIGDLGAMAGDVGFLPTMSYCGRIRGDVLNMTALICGNRFGRGLLCPAGMVYDLDKELIDKLMSRLNDMKKDVTGALKLMFDTPSVLSRFEGTGALSEKIARETGLVGVAARATGLDCDVRREFPYGIYCFSQMPTCTWHTGDCFARAYVRWLEINASIEFIRRQLLELPEGAISRGLTSPRAGFFTVSLVEGWRGEICHVAATDSKGCFSFYKVVDPSFHNWFGIALALRKQQISDFPLCNKSFNLSYCGHDL